MKIYAIISLTLLALMLIGTFIYGVVFGFNIPMPTVYAAICYTVLLNFIILALLAAYKLLMSDKFNHFK